MRDQQARFLDAGRGAISDREDRFDAFEPGDDGDGAGVEAVGGQGARGGVDLPEAGGGLDFDRGVICAKGERAGFASDVERLRHEERGGERRGFQRCSENSVRVQAFSTGLINSTISNWRVPSVFTCQSRICSPWIRVSAWLGGSSMLSRGIGACKIS